MVSRYVDIMKTQKKPNGRQLVLTDVDVERDCQEAKWGEQNNSALMWITILVEEVGEAAKEAFEADLQKMRAELVQVAAVAVAAIECIDRQNRST